MSRRRMGGGALKPVVALVTATTKEKDAILRLLREHYRSPSYMEGRWPLLELPNVFVVVFSQDGKGTLNAVTAVEEVIQQYRPVLVVCVGVCGGIRDSVSIRKLDLVVGARTIYYEPEKEMESEDNEWRPQVCPDPGRERGLEGAEGVVMKLARTGGKGMSARKLPLDFIKKIANEPEENKHPRIRIHFGKVFASGERFLCTSSIEDMAKKVHSCNVLPPEICNEGICAVDMETFGAACACAQSQTKFLFVKSVSDIGETDPGNKLHTLGTMIAASATIEWLKDLDKKARLALLRRCWKFSGDKKDFEVSLRDNLTNVVQLGIAMFPSVVLTVGDPIVRKRMTTSMRSVYDKVIEDFLRQEVCKRLSVQFVGDNARDAGRAARLIEKRVSFMLADAVDGTENLAAGRLEVAISIAYYAEGELRCGVIGLPYMGMTVCAEKGHPQLTVNGLEWKADGKERADKLEDAIVAVPGDLHRLEAEDPHGLGARTAELVRIVSGKARAIRISGSIAYDLASLALGQIDARISTHATPADVAAGSLIVRKVGGVVKDLTGRDWSLESTSLLAASTEKLYDELCSLCRNVLER